MADNVKVGFQVTGDSADALAAIKQLADGVVKLASVLEQFNNKAAASSTKAGAAINKVKEGYDKAAAAAQRLQGAAAAVKPSNIVAPAPSGAGAAALKPGTDAVASSGKAVSNISAMFSSVTSAVSKFKTFSISAFSKISSFGVSAFRQVSAAVYLLSARFPIITSLGGLFNKVIGGIKSSFSSLTASPVFSKLAQSFSVLVSQGSAAVGKLKMIFTQLQSALAGKFGPIVSQASSAFSKISVAGAKTVSKVSALFNKLASSGTFYNISVLAKAAFSSVASAGKGAVSVLTTTLGRVGGVASSVFGVLRGAGSKAFGAVKAAATSSGSAFFAVMSKILGKTGILGVAIAGVGAAIRGAFGGRSSGLLSSFASRLDTLSKGFLNFVDVVRMSAQGITNMGRVLFFFLTIPAVAFLKNLASAAIEFEDALIRVQKTTNLASGSIEEYEGTMLQLKDLLRDQANYSMRSHVEIAQIAEVIGQMGVTSVPAIANLTQIFDMMATTMGVGAEDVATSLGRIANAFQWNLNASSDEVFRLGNVINYLENTTAASAAEIMTAMGKWAQAANLLGITAAEAAGLSAAMVSMGLTEEEAGTALKRLSTQLAANIDEITALMGANEKYADRTATLNAINEDAVGVFLDIAEAARAARDAGQSAQALEALINVADERGGRALAALANNIQFVRQVLDASNTEWERATSLIEEYNRAMTSTKAHLAAVKNNINDAAITIGDALLPLIRQITTVMIPAIQMFSNWFKNLSRRAQMTGLAIAGLVVIAGPLIMVFGQLLHGVFLIFQGFGMLGKAVAFAITHLTGFLKVGGVISKVVTVWPLAIVAAAVAILKVLSKMGVDVAGFFVKLASNASAWGRSLMETYGTGLASAANFVLQIVSKIAGLIARFFEAHSPPKVGPLSTIDQWGSTLLQTFLDGFKNADFSVLEDVGSIIEHILTRGVEEDDMPDVLKKYAKARVKLAQLIEQFNATGIIDEGLLAEATDGLGSMADEVQELIRLQMRYNQLQQELADLESKRKGVLKTYDAEVAAAAASNMSIEEKVAAIRAAQSVRDDSLRSIEEEKLATEEQADALKLQLEYQEKMIDAMNTQDDLLQKIIDAMNRASSRSGGGEDAGAGEDFAFGEIDTTEFDSTFEEAQEQIMSFRERIEEGRDALQGFFDAFAGRPETLEEDWLGSSESFDMYNTMYELGMKVRDVVDWFTKLKDTVSGLNISDKLSSIGESLSNSPFVQKLGEAISFLGTVFTPVIELFKNTFMPLWEQISNQFNTLILPAWNNLVAAFDRFKPVLAMVAAVLGAILSGIIQGIGRALPGIITIISSVISGIMNFIAGVMDTITGIVTIIIGLFTKTSDGGAKLKEGFELLKQGLFNTLVGIVTAVTGILGGALQAVFGFFAGFIEGVFNFFNSLFSTLTGAADEIGNGIVESISNWITNALDDISEFINGVIEFFLGLYDDLVGHSIIPDMLSDIITSFTEFFGDIIDDVSEWISDVISTIAGFVGEFVGAGADLLSGLAEGIGGAVGGVIQEITGAVSEVIDTVLSLLGIASPSKVFMGIGINTGLGFVEGISDMSDQVNSAVVDSMVSPALNAAVGLGDFSFAAGTIAPAQPAQYQVNLNFGKDSVRNDDDIAKIAAEVERILLRKTKLQVGYGTGLR